MAPGEHELGAGRGRGEGQAPGVGVEHWHHRQHDIARGNPGDVRLQLAQGVEIVRAVGVGHALGRAGGARGEAQPARRRLREVAPVVPAAIDPVHRALERLADVRRAVDRQHMPNPRRIRRDRAGQRGEVGARDQHRRLGLARHPRELLGGKPGIERVAHCAHAHDRVPGLEMRLGVPRQRRHPVALSDAEVGQHRRDLLGALAQCRVADAQLRTVVARGNDLLVGMPPGRMVEELVEGKREILHRAIDHRHCGTCGGSGGEITPTFQFHC